MDAFLTFFNNSTYTRVKLLESKTLKNWLILHFEYFNGRNKGLKISEFWTYFWSYFSNSIYKHLRMELTHNYLAPMTHGSLSEVISIVTPFNNQ